MPGSPIRNVHLIKTVFDFNGLKYERGLYPTDIDAFIDFGDEGSVIIEAKSNGADMPKGQKMALERLSDDISSTRRKRKASLLICCQYTSYTEEGTVLLDACEVVSYRSRCKWYEPKRLVTVKELIDEWRKVFNLAPREAL